MATRRVPARQAARWQSADHLWLDHAAIHHDDLEWMSQVRRLTMWNVALPAGYLVRLPHLWWVDVRGGSGTDVAFLAGCERLRYLRINQVRGVRDLTAIVDLGSLELLSLYGLPRVEELPSMAGLTALRRAELGSMKGLRSMAGLLRAPKLAEILLIREVKITDDDLDRLAHHPTLGAFDWFAEDVPDRVWVPVRERMSHLPRPTTYDAATWFSESGEG